MIINVALVSILALCAHYIDHPMIMIVFDGVIIGSLFIGLLFFFGTSIGVLRFPDFFTRLHAAGKGDTLSTILILFACALFSIKSAHAIDKITILTSIKILLIINFIFIGSPTATHALINAGYQSEVKPWEKEKKPEK